MNEMAGKEQEGRVRSYLREFSEGTTLHGVRYVGENNRHWTERSCWIVAMVFCTIFCGLEVAKVWHRWHDSPVIISFASRPTRVRDIPFPALTICPGLQIPRDNFDISSVTEHIYDQNNLTPNLNYFIHDCKWNGTYNCTNYFRPIIFTERGVCHTFNMMQDADIYYNHSIDMSKDDNETHTYLHNVSTKSGGSHWGMQLIFKVPLDQYQDNCCLQYNDVCQSHFEVYLHAPLELAWYNPIKVTPWSDTEVRLRPLVASTDPALQAHSPYTRGCRFPQDQKLKYFKGILQRKRPKCVTFVCRAVMESSMKQLLTVVHWKRM
ncbi:hypothetical protein B566_EDAN002444 [Ephemera danica]|nr:hypothetical protein B566_EDAN002444 [Ephemera danica]